ncbi:conserved hypothetical protein [Trichinella spiralis]|uniref:hypothetical protein n=1 Tax=Trichinella spiralis TaxID=6334 RepID=UPI0001EFEB4C|nr:conserved hypothetical protein [Trichinella spiralis]
MANLPFYAQLNRSQQIVKQCWSATSSFVKLLQVHCLFETIRTFKRPTSKPRTIQPEKLLIRTSFDQERFEHACEQLQCSFNEDESGSQPCANYLLRNVKVTSGKSGNRHTGINAAYCNSAVLSYLFLFWCNIVCNLLLV